MSEDRDPDASVPTPDRGERGADAPGDPHAGRTGKRVVGTGTDASLRVDQAEPIIDEVEEEEVADHDAPRNDRLTPDDRHVP